MKQLKKTILTLALLIAATTQAWADYTVTWEGTKLQSINVSKGFGTNVTTETMTVDGITVTANKGFLYYGGSTMHFDSGEADGIVFSAENNIKSIAITSTSSSRFIPDGSFQDGGSHTYELNPAAKSYGFGKGVVIDGVTKIVITLESPVTFTRGTGDKANTWTMDGGMPAGNVIVNAEYYQDAAFAMSSDATPVALAPTANNSAKANTDDPLVTGGEVANIVEGTEALEAKQGTLMYYFDKDKATTQMTAAQLEALTADEWSDKVPTADGLHFDAATDVFVYYYIKGADDVAGLADGVKHTFSDSAPVCLTVSVQKEPSFKVELNAEGLTTEEAANWKAAKGSATPAAFPLTGVKKDDKVTVTYSGSRKVIGVKAEKKPAAPTSYTIVAGYDIKSTNVTTFPFQFTHLNHNTMNGMTAEVVGGDGKVSATVNEMNDCVNITVTGAFDTDAIVYVMEQGKTKEDATWSFSVICKVNK